MEFEWQLKMKVRPKIVWKKAKALRMSVLNSLGVLQFIDLESTLKNCFSLPPVSDRSITIAMFFPFMHYNSVFSFSSMTEEKSLEQR